METSGVTPKVAVTAPDLATVLERSGPFATVYLTTEPGIDNAAHRSEQRWKTLRAQMDEAGAPATFLDDVDPLVGEAHLHGRCLGVVGTAEGVVHVEYGGEPPVQDFGSWSALPSLIPMLRWRQTAPAHVVVLADRRGADLMVVRHGAPDVHREAGGDEDPLAKSAPGGWSQRRYQQRAENTWEHNAEDVAAEVVRLVEACGARLVLAGGDVRALQLLQEALPAEVAEILDTIDGGRSPDGSEDVVTAEVERRVATAVASDTAALLEKFREERGQGDRAVEGVAATIGALAMSQVEVLLLPDQPDDTREAWFGPEPSLVATNAGDLQGLGVDSPTKAPLADVLVRTALGTGAGIRLVPPEGELAEDVGAILRWGR